MLQTVDLAQIDPMEIETGKVYLGLVEVEMGKMNVFGKHQRLNEMVSFVPGFGNGNYEVYGKIEKVPDHGFKITKIEIEFISKEEIKYYQKNSI